MPDDRILRHAARAALEGGCGADGVRHVALALAFRTGVTITYPQEVFVPVANHMCMRYGTANFEACTKALGDGTLRFTADSFADLIAAACEDKAAFDACRIIVEYCAGHDIDIPPDLARWQALAPKRPHRGDFHRLELRDNAIVAAVWMLHRKYRVHPTRDDATEHRHSACDYVANALRELGLPGGYDAVKKVWQHCAEVLGPDHCVIMGTRQPRRFPMK